MLVVAIVLRVLFTLPLLAVVGLIGVELYRHVRTYRRHRAEIAALVAGCGGLSPLGVKRPATGTIRTGGLRPLAGAAAYGRPFAEMAGQGPDVPECP